MKGKLIIFLLCLSAIVCAQETEYSNDWQRMNIPEGTWHLTVKTQADGKEWSSIYYFNEGGYLYDFLSFVDGEQLYEWQQGDNREEAESLMSTQPMADSTTTVEIVMYEDLTLMGCTEAIWNRYYVGVYPISQGVWELRYIEYESDEETQVKGALYTTVSAKKLRVYTRNYGNETIPLYELPDKHSKVVTTIKKTDTLLHPYAIDWKNGFYLVKYHGKWCWISSFWTCANPYTNCC